MKRLGKNEFVSLLGQLPVKVMSKTGSASYSKFSIVGDVLKFKRNNTGKMWEININELFDAYQNLETINTILIKQYVSGRVYSPSCAVLIAMNLYDEKGNLKS